MRFFSSFVSALLVAGASTAYAASWSFNEATVTVRGKGAGEGVKETFSAGSPLSKPVSLSPGESLRIQLTTLDGKKAKRAHQAFLTLSQPSSGLEESFAFTVKENGKGKVDISHKDLPAQFTSTTLNALVTIASFGSTEGYRSQAFTLSVTPDPLVSAGAGAESIRYKALPEIHHVFRADPKSPPKIITLVFTLAVLAALPVLVGAWGLLGANINHLPKALGAAPIAHVLFFGSIISIEGIFYLYYTSWNLFQTLPVAGAFGLLAFLSGSHALTEVQERRLAGLR